jgi:membrane protein implicated in regulation of membrane protease activity
LHYRFAMGLTAWLVKIAGCALFAVATAIWILIVLPGLLGYAPLFDLPEDVKILLVLLASVITAGAAMRGLDQHRQDQLQYYQDSFEKLSRIEEAIYRESGQWGNRVDVLARTNEPDPYLDQLSREIELGTDRQSFICLAPEEWGIRTRVVGANGQATVQDDIPAAPEESPALAEQH